MISKIKMDGYPLFFYNHLNLANCISPQRIRIISPSLPYYFAAVFVFIYINLVEKYIEENVVTVSVEISYFIVFYLISPDTAQ